ncbi:MAG: FGGY-family carbohydrate kinase [Pseudomonadota bacterium]
MDKDLVIGIDSSTSATKATLWDRDGAFIGEGRVGIEMTNPMPGRFEQDATEWWASTAGALRQVTEQVDPARIAAVSISNQRETFALFDEAGEPTGKGTVWLDERAVAECAALTDAVGADEIREICGKPVDVILPINRMMWLRQNSPEAWNAARHYADVHCYLAYQLTGRWVTSTASADPSGMLDLAAGRWSQRLLEQAGVPLALMPELVKPGEVMGAVHDDAASATGLLAGTPLIAGGGDGQCAATGAGAVMPSHAYMNLGTAAVAGVYAPLYATDQAFRTETAVSDTGYIFETVLKSGTFLIDWFARELGGAREAPIGDVLKTLEAEAATSPIGAGGVVMLPFLQGSMTPHWDFKARGILAGLSGFTKRGDIYRALLEGIALDQAYALDKAMASIGGHIETVTAIGGGSASTLFLQIIADAMNVPVTRAAVVEASALGAAMCAAKGAGWYPTIEAATKAMGQEVLTEITPQPEAVARYSALRAIYDDLWPTLSQWNTRLWDFANAP